MIRLFCTLFQDLVSYIEHLKPVTLVKGLCYLSHRGQHYMGCPQQTERNDRQWGFCSSRLQSAVILKSPETIVCELFVWVAWRYLVDSLSLKMDLHLLLFSLTSTAAKRHTTPNRLAAEKKGWLWTHRDTGTELLLLQRTVCVCKGQGNLSDMGLGVV